jgi:hypothetical protein
MRTLETVRQLAEKDGISCEIIDLQTIYPYDGETIHEMARYRFLIYLHELDELTTIHPHTNYYLDFSLFGTRFKLKLDLKPSLSSLLIKKLRLCYFFFPLAQEHQNLQ